MVSKRSTLLGTLFVLVFLLVSTALAAAQSTVYVPVIAEDGQSATQENTPENTPEEQADTSEPEPVGQEVSAESHLPVRIIRFQNIGNDANFNTGVSASTHHCVATGWSGYWDIQENDAGGNYVWTQVNTTLNTWFIRGSMRSHNNHESLDVDLVCFRTDLASFEGASRSLFDPD
jgi:hypothetical protein